MKHSIELCVILGLTFAGPAIADAFDHQHMYGDNGFGMFMGPVFMLVLLAALVVGIVALI